MKLNTVIFDMDGLLIDSEPLWNEASNEILKDYDISLTEEEYAVTIGLRTKECLKWWLQSFSFSEDELVKIERRMFGLVLEKIKYKAGPMQGVKHIVSFFHERNFKIGVASSSPRLLIDEVMRMCGIKHLVQGIASAEELSFGKPHPQVYLECAESLESDPLSCVCFEDSLNGLIAAKAARMKCVVVPHHSQAKDKRWALADLQLSSLQNFGELHLNMLQ